MLADHSAWVGAAPVTVEETDEEVGAEAAAKADEEADEVAGEVAGEETAAAAAGEAGEKAAASAEAETDVETVEAADVEQDSCSACVAAPRSQPSVMVVHVLQAWAVAVADAYALTAENAVVVL